MIKNHEHNLMMLEAVASALGNLLEKVVFVGGSITVLLVDDFLNVLPGLLGNPDSATAIEDSLKIMASWADD